MAKTNSAPLVSIVVPIWNAGQYLAETIQSVQKQTYPKWELILVDDCSDDHSVQIAQKAQKTDQRIKLIRNKENSGAAVTRNNGIKAAKGDYLCFLDSDDLWLPEKLEDQIGFMRRNRSKFSFASYEFADESGKPNGKKAKVPSTITYRQALKNTVIFTSTVMLDLHQLDREIIYMPDIRRGQDMVTWWQILKTIDHAHGLDEVLALYRRHSNTLSSNKFRAIRQNWHFYREVEKLGFLDALFCFSCYCINATLRRI